MRIAVMGTGREPGGYFGGLLARAGEEVTFIARGGSSGGDSQRRSCNKIRFGR